MQETRREIVDRVLRFVGEIDDDDTRAIVNDLVWSAVQAMWLRHPFREFVLPVDITLAFTVNQPLYVLPMNFGRVASKDGCLRNLTTGRRIQPDEGGLLERRHPEIGGTQDTETGDPSRYVIAGKCGLNVQVAPAGEDLEALSSSAADLVLLEVEGVSGGQYQTLQFILNGQNAVALGNWTYVQSVAKSYPVGTTPTTALTSSAGTVTIRQAVTSATRQTLLPYEASREQYQLRVWPTPQSVQTIAIPAIRLPRRIFQDSDPIPALWGPALFDWVDTEYRVNTGELTRGAADIMHQQSPSFLSLIGADNESKSGARLRKRPFGQ